jgi:UDP-N-acetylglucosamine--N-acetylmuramyl-(pentapeptide) pyrophosphoryl-undecaprenol N-acetylglucosamine transferase
MTNGGGSTYAVIAGGGTAGHVSPGIAIARALIDRGHPADSIHYVGSARGIEREMVPAAGLGLTLLPGRGIARKLSLASVAAAAGIVVAVGQAIGLLRRLRPCVVVALGGYASVPCAVAARALRIPVVVAEQNAVPGLANRLVARWARACAVSFPETVLPRAILTGNPVRDEVRDLDRTRDRGGARERLGLDDGHKLVTVYGGSLGARRINRAAARSVPELTAAGDVVLRHIVGSRDWDTEARPDASDVYVPVRYETDMATVLLASDVVVCRAGASTVAELAVAATPSILVPLPGAPGDHQTANARAMVTAGGAVLVPDADLSTERLIAEVRTVLADPDRLASMSAGAATLARRDAAAAVAALAEEHARD